MMRFFKLFLFIISSCCIVLLLLANSQLATRALINYFKPPELKIGVIQGTLASPLILQKVIYTQGNLKTEINSLHLNWRPLALLHGKIDIQELAIDDIHIHQLAVSKSASQTAHKALPLTWAVNNFNLASISVYNPQKVLLFQTKKLTASGRYNQQQVSLNAHWECLIAHLNQAYKLKNQAGSLTLQGSPKLATLSSMPDVTITFTPSKLTSKLIPIQVNATFIHGNIAIIEFGFTASNANFNLKYAFTQPFRMQWQSTIKDLGELFPTSQGTLHTSGLLFNSHGQSLLIGNLSAKDIRYIDYQLKHLQLNFDLDTQPHGKTELKLIAEQIGLTNRLIKHMAFSLVGTSTSHLIKAQLATNKSMLTLAAQGTIAAQRQQWQGSLNELKLISTSVGNWALKTAAQLFFSPTTMQISPLCLQAQQQSLCLQVKWDREATSYVNFNAAGLSLEHLKFFLPPQAELQAVLDAKVNLATTEHHQWQGNAYAHISKGWMLYPILQEKHRFNFAGGDLIAALTADLLTAKLNLNAMSEQNLNANLMIKRPLLPSQPIIGDVNLSLHNLDLLAAFIPDIINPRGTLAAKLQLTGNLAKPILMGNAALTDAQVEIPRLGIMPKNIKLSVTGQQTGELNFNGSAHSGAGSLNFQGQTSLLATDTPLTLNITGKQFLISQTPEYVIAISPKLTLKKQGSTIKLTGDLLVPKASIKPHKYSQESVELTNDIKYTNADGQIVDETPFGIVSDIYLTLGEQVAVDYYGLTGSLTGALHIHDRPDISPIGSGQILLEGSYKAYGKKLQIQQGRVLFSGGLLTNPSLDIQAEKTVTASTATTSSGVADLSNAASLVGVNNKIIVGVNVQGTLQNRQITLYSKPPVLNQPDILSYIILGRPASQATKADAQLLYNAATALDFGGNQIGQLSEQVRNSFGLDEINIGTMNTNAPKSTAPDVLQNTSLILGKALSPKLYINYSIGLLQPINTLRLRYFFTPKWILQSETNSISNALDLFYTFEKN